MAAAHEQEKEEDLIDRGPARYLQVAQRIARDIQRGRYQPGDLLPSESAMVRLYGVGKHTVRMAMAELRGMGLAESRQGKGTIVLDRGGVLPSTEVDRSVQLANGQWSFRKWQQSEPPAVTRISIEGPPGVLLDQQDQDAFSVDRTLYCRDTGAYLAHRLIIPLATAADVPSLADRPDAEIISLYQQLADAGIKLTHTEHVTARIPYPDERAALHLDDASPLLITYRVTADADRDRPLLCEELKAPAAACQLVFPLPPTRPTVKRPRRRTSRSE